jgi:bifunctional oligoribonuclease and PAP phosphatase NrnA
MRTFTDIQRRCQGAKQVIIVPHIYPDGDALGAAFGLQGMLQSTMTSHVKVVGAHIDNTTWMGSFERVADSEWAQSVVIVVDTAKKELLMDQKALEGTMVILIDHHPAEAAFYDHAILDDRATSTCEILAQLALRESLSLNPKTANCLLFGILSDTTILQHPYTSKLTMNTISYLMEEGATYKPLVNQLTKRPFATTQTLFQASSSIQVTDHGLAYWILDYPTIQSNGFAFNDLFHILRSIQEASIIVLLVQLDHEYVLHAQSDQFDLQKLLAPFGGGGHKFASKVRAPSITPLLEVIESLDQMLSTSKRK